ncbi:iron-containing redox enzyme family protein [Alkalinema sp. FACHB-956]|uniref:TenA family transcriptional regulator n=1 Tax=Alkalinema sp. FACHB-956 TaxID=2692768 RepID=UPI00168863B2|nr:iron-containing redox enzyme family protein [Alkalinema sp. FACHB-956]MBD2329182.1 iron-containing redox enzyme family protein [Alkalinema sp. FACHB-956]
MKIETSPFIQTFRDLAHSHELWQHPFLKRCREGQLTLPEVQILAVQMYKFSKEFNRILASILSCCPDEEAQWIILDNLFDEMGQGDLSATHPELFRRFTRAIGIPDANLLEFPATVETQAMIQTYLSLAHQYNYLAALGAICFASEGIVHSLYSQLYQGIQGAAPLTREDLIFFELHIDVDDSHAAKLLALLEPRIQNENQAIDIHRAILEALDARVQFFDGIQRRIEQMQTFTSLACRPAIPSNRLAFQPLVYSHSAS